MFRGDRMEWGAISKDLVILCLPSLSGVKIQGFEWGRLVLSSSYSNLS